MGSLCDYLSREKYPQDEPQLNLPWFWFRKLPGQFVPVHCGVWQSFPFSQREQPVLGWQTSLQIIKLVDHASFLCLSFNNNICCAPMSSPHCKEKMPKIGSKYSQKRNIGASVLISVFMCLWANYIFPRWSCRFCWRKYVDRSWEYINRSQTHECRKWGWGRAIPRKGINKRNCLCSAGWILVHRYMYIVHCTDTQSPEGIAQ